MLSGMSVQNGWECNMRRKLNIKRVAYDTKRVTKRFAWFPEVLHDDYKVWLEFYYVEQAFRINMFGEGWWQDQKTWSQSTHENSNSNE